MGIFLTNIAHMSAIRAFSSVTSKLDTVYKRLASGKRINSAKDDPAGLRIANRLTSQINGYKQGNRNLNDGLSITQTMEGALDETLNMLQRIRTLSVQAATGTNSDDERASITAEVQQLCQEITRISKKTTYGGTSILNGKESNYFNNGSLQIQCSGTAWDTISIPCFEDGFSMSGLTTYTNVGTSANFIEKDGDSVRFSLSTAENAQGVLSAIDKYISAVTKYQGTLGGLQNRFESAIRLNDTMSTNLQDARSRIEDTDYAEEAANLAKYSVQQQVAASIMKMTANSKNIILSLLQN